MGLDDFVKSRYTLWQCRLGTHTELSIVMTMNNEDEMMMIEQRAQKRRTSLQLWQVKNAGAKGWKKVGVTRCTLFWISH
ncbi:hypothetical protein GGG16DRAFT_120033 [Schizophyllum commune]